MATAVPNLPRSMEDIEEAEVVDETKSVAAIIGEKVEHATEAVGAGMESLGQVLHEHKPKPAALASATETVANKLESGGRYLEQKGMKGMCEDVTQLVRENPIPALIIGLGVGFALARILRS